MAGGQRHRGLGPCAVPGAGGQSPAWLIACHPAYRADVAGTRAHTTATGEDFPPGMPQGTAPAILGLPAVAGVLARGPEEEFRRDLHHRAALRRSARQGMHRGMPRRLHLRGRAHALYPPGRVRGLRRMRAGLPGRGHLLRRRRAGPVEGLLQGERRVLRGPRLAGRRGQDRQDPQGPPADRRPAAAGAGGGALSAAGGAPSAAGGALTAGGRAPTLAARLPPFPWDALEPAKATAAAHPGGIVDLSVGTPVDPVPRVVRDALAAASDSPGYPAAAGTPALREAAAAWLARQHGVL